MHLQKPLRTVSFLMLVILFLVGCSADCFFASTAKAWIDKDEDGVWDPEESALPGVQFFVDDVRNQHRNVGDEAISDERGEALVYVWLPGCPRVKFEIYAIPPSGYRLTTPRRIPAYEQDEGPFLFGFAPTTDDG